MSGPGTFLVSFDCEGKWGMADHLTPALAAALTNVRIYCAYEEILKAFRHTGLRGTFAFVGALTLTREELDEFHELFRDTPVNGRPWLTAFNRDAAHEELDGWLSPLTIRHVLAEGCHEIATHGFTHLPLDEATVDTDLFRHEMNLVRKLAFRQGWTPRTIVYPRNQVGHTTLLAETGILGYREMLWPRWRGSGRQFRSLLAEFGLPSSSQVHAPFAETIAIPSGHFLNCWINRSRRIVPRQATVRRWREMMLHAAETGGVVHLWSHPHNFITDPDLITTFGMILKDAARLVHEGRLINATMGEYCQLGRLIGC